jgi:hypothetical protein
MKIGFLVHFFDFRNDVRKYIEVLSNQGHEVILFCKEEDFNKIKEHNSRNEIRIILDKKKSYLNFILERIFLIFKVLPKSKTNYFLMEYFKASGSSRKILKKALTIISLQKIFNGYISYDRLLKYLKYKELTKINDIDFFLVFTEITDDYFFARIQNNNIPHLIYVYSWDHPSKHAKFSKKSNYLVWNYGIKEDLIQLQNIKEQNISVFGATQFGFIYDYLIQSKYNKHYNFNYIYFGCSVGLLDVAKEEVNYIYEIAIMLLKIKPDWKLVVRPYPHLNQWCVYDDLKKIENVIFDDQYKKKDYAIDYEEIYLKFKKIEEAEYFIHSGSTIGLEACFFNTPSLIITPNKNINFGINNFYNFAFQYQNNKYLIESFPLNCFSNMNEFERIIQFVPKHELLELSNNIKRQFQIKSFNQLGSDLMSIFDDYVKA